MLRFSLFCNRKWLFWSQSWRGLENLKLRITGNFLMEIHSLLKIVLGIKPRDTVPLSCIPILSLIFYFDSVILSHSGWARTCNPCVSEFWDRFHVCATMPSFNLLFTRGRILVHVGILFVIKMILSYTIWNLSVPLVEVVFYYHLLSFILLFLLSFINDIIKYHLILINIKLFLLSLW